VDIQEVFSIRCLLHHRKERTFRKFTIPTIPKSTEPKRLHKRVTTRSTQVHN